MISLCLLLNEQTLHLVNCFGNRQHFFRRKLANDVFGREINHLDDGFSGVFIQAELDTVVNRFEKIIDCLDGFFELRPAGFRLLPLRCRLLGLELVGTRYRLSARLTCCIAALPRSASSAAWRKRLSCCRS